jgi:hypothetical protein
LQLLLGFWLPAACVAFVALAVCYTKGVTVELFMAVRNSNGKTSCTYFGDGSEGLGLFPSLPKAITAEIKLCIKQ